MTKNKLLIVILFIVLLISGAYIVFHYLNSQKNLPNNKIELNNNQENNITTINSIEDNDLKIDDEEQSSNKLLSAQSPHGFELSYSSSELKFYNDKVSGLFMFCDMTAYPPDDIRVIYDDMPTYGCMEISLLSPSQDFEDFSDKILVDKFNESIDGNSGQYYVLKSKEKIKLGDTEFYRAVYWLGEEKGGYMYLGLLDNEKNKIIEADYFYDDYSVRNDKIIPIFEKTLGTLKNVDKK